MNRLATVCAIGMGLLLVAVAGAATPNEQPKATEIPLDQIWGYNLPGTRDVRDLEPKRDIRNMTHKEFLWGSLVNRIAARLEKGPNRGEKADSAFVVVGTDKEALKNADDVFLGRQPRKESFPTDMDLTLVFFSHPSSLDMKIVSVEKSTGQIQVKYQCLSTQPSESRIRNLESAVTRFALIPLGRLPAGEVQASIEQLPPVDQQGKPVKLVRDPRTVVCNSASLTVQ